MQVDSLPRFQQMFEPGDGFPLVGIPQGETPEPVLRAAQQGAAFTIQLIQLAPLLEVFERHQRPQEQSRGLGVEVLPLSHGRGRQSGIPQGLENAELDRRVD